MADRTGFLRLLYCWYASSDEDVVVVTCASDVEEIVRWFVDVLKASPTLQQIAAATQLNKILEGKFILLGRFLLHGHGMEGTNLLIVT